ncbi:MAG: ATP-binding protein [Magnetococcales bacterium]|nr:ATP-binding protein [Magnetococcales bacterium]
MDVGFARFRKAIRALPPLGEAKNPDPNWHELSRLYTSQLEAPLFSVQQAPVIQGQVLTAPRIVQAFIPQAFRGVRHALSERHYGDDLFWAQFLRRTDLGRFLLLWLQSAYSAHTPLVILAPPGAGKTLLSRILAAHLSSSAFHPVRVVLGAVDAKATIQAQIEEQLRNDTGAKIDWGTLSHSVRNRFPVVVLDGMNELLGANEKIFRDYPEKARRFQELEGSMGRPVRLVITSRTEVIDRADIPAGAVVLRLEPFDEAQRSHWIRLWNRTNRPFFKSTGLHPLVATENPAVIQLAETPFLLSLLAVLDADGNPLQGCGVLTRAGLFQQITQRFVTRSLAPGQSETPLLEMQRLGAAALGMFHRHTLSIRSDQLEKDAQLLIPDGVAGTENPLVAPILERLFFVNVTNREHRARPGSMHREKESARSFSFWHGSFGEFLIADFILRMTWDETIRLFRERRGRNRTQRKLAEERFINPANTPERWFASLMYTPLFDRPCILAMMRERLQALLEPEKGERGTVLSREDFLATLDDMIQGQLAWILQGNAPPLLMTGGRGAWFTPLPLMGYFAIYSLNLIILRSVLDTRSWVFNEAAFAGEEDGTPAWDRLTHLWRSWFTDERLSRLRGILQTRRQDGRMHIQARPLFSCVRSVRGLKAYQELARVLADDAAANLATQVLEREENGETPNDKNALFPAKGSDAFQKTGLS